LVLDHINGIDNDHRLKNLRLLCPNCNSQTRTFAGKNIKVGRVRHTCADCGVRVSKANSRCRACANKKRKTKINWPSPTRLRRMVTQTNVNQVAGELGVTWNAVKARLEKNKDL
jgi:predicted amidophosphoribosyltransferase